MGQLGNPSVRVPDAGQCLRVWSIGGLLRRNRHQSLSVSAMTNAQVHSYLTDVETEGRLTKHGTLLLRTPATSQQALTAAKRAITNIQAIDLAQSDPTIWRRYRRRAPTLFRPLFL